MTEPEVEMLSSADVFTLAVSLLEEMQGQPADQAVVTGRNLLIGFSPLTLRRVAATTALLGLNRQSGEDVASWLERLRLEQAVQS